MATKTEEAQQAAAWSGARERVAHLLKEHSVQLLRDYDVPDEAWRADPAFEEAIQYLADAVVGTVNKQS